MNTHLPVRLSNKWADRFLLGLNGENVVPDSLKKLLMVTNIIFIFISLNNYSSFAYADRYKLARISLGYRHDTGFVGKVSRTAGCNKPLIANM